MHLEVEDVQFLLFKQPPHVDEDVDVDIHLGDEDVRFVHLKQPPHVDEDVDVDIHLGDEDVQFVLFKQPPHVDEDVDVDLGLGDEDVHLEDVSSSGDLEFGGLEIWSSRDSGVQEVCNSEKLEFDGSGHLEF